MKKSLVSFITVLMTGALLTACDDHGSTPGADTVTPVDTPPSIPSIPSTPSPDVTKPTVVETSPEPDATDVDRSASLRAVFSEPMQAESLDSGSYVLRRAENVIASTLGYDAESLTASLTPDQPLSMLTQYTVELGADLADTAGNTLGVLKIFSFVTADGAFQPTIEFAGSTLNGNDYIGGHFSNTGSGVFIWQQIAIGDHVQSLYAFNFSPATQLWTLTLLDDVDSPVTPSLAVNAGGDAVVIWRRSLANLGEGIVARYFDASTQTWSAPAQVAPAPSGVSSPNVGLSDTGVARAVWTRNGSPQVIVSAVYEAASNTWGQHAVISASTNNSTYPFIASADASRAIAVWKEESTKFAVASTFDAGSWGTPVVLGSAGENRVFQPVVASDGSNAVLWTHTTSFSSFNLYATQYDWSTGQWETAVSLASTDAFAPVLSYDVDIGSGGRAIAGWVSGPDGNRHEYASFRDDTGHWSVPTALDTAAPGLSAPHVALDDAGNALFAWSEQSTSKKRLVSRRYLAGSDLWAEPFTLADTLDSDEVYVELAPDGTGAAGWWERDSMTSFRHPTIRPFK